MGLAGSIRAASSFLISRVFLRVICNLILLLTLLVLKNSPLTDLVLQDSVGYVYVGLF